MPSDRRAGREIMARRRVCRGQSQLSPNQRDTTFIGPELRAGWNDPGNARPGTDVES